MKLYHGSNIVIDQIDLSKCNPYKNDTIATLFRNFDDGIIDLQMLVNGLKYKKFHHNICFIRQKPLNICTDYE